MWPVSTKEFWSFESVRLALPLSLRKQTLRLHTYASTPVLWNHLDFYSISEKSTKHQSNLYIGMLIKDSNQDLIGFVVCVINKILLIYLH